MADASEGGSLQDRMMSGLTMMVGIGILFGPIAWVDGVSLWWIITMAVLTFLFGWSVSPWMSSNSVPYHTFASWTREQKLAFIERGGKVSASEGVYTPSADNL